MATRTISKAGGKWGETTAWVEGAVPTNADDVVATAESANLEIAANATCRSIDLTGYTKELKHGSFNLSISGSTAAPSNKVVVFPAAGWTYTLTSATLSKIVLANTVASTVHLIDFGGKTTGNVEITSNPPATSTYKWTGTHLMGATSTMSMGRGVFDVNGQSCTWGLLLISGSATREFKPGAAAITISGVGSAFNSTETTNLTIAANTATVTMSGAAANFIGGGKDWNGMTLKMTGSGIQVVNNPGGKLANLERVGTAVKTDALEVTVGSALTVTGKATFTGNSLTNRLLVSSTTPGTIVAVTAAEVSLANVDFMDVKGEGAGKWEGTSVGNALGNEGITFTTPVTRYAKAAGSFSSTAVWAATSGGAAGASVPLCHDTVKMDATAGAGTYTCDMPRACADLDCTGFTRTLTFNTTVSIYGSRTFVAGMTHTVNGSIFYRGRGTHTLTNAGKENGTVSIFAPGGSYTLTDSLNLGITRNLNLTQGTFDAAGFNVTCLSVQSSNTNLRTIKGGAGTWTVGGQPTVFTISNSTNLTIDFSETTVLVTDVSANNKSFTVGTANPTFKKIVGPASGSGILIFSAGFTVGTLEIQEGRAVQFASAATVVITEELAISGSAGNLVTVTASTGASAAILKKTSGIVAVDYVSLKDSKAEGGATFYAGAHSTNVSGNSGWAFEEGPQKSQYPAAVKADSPLAYWPMDDESGNAVEANGGTAITMSGILYQVLGPVKYGNWRAFSFDGVNDYGQVALNLSAVSTLTVEFFLKWDVNGSGDDFALEHSATTNSNTGWNVDWDNSTGGAEANTVSVKWMASGSTSSPRRYTFARPSAATWHHVVLVIPVNGALTAYLDGKEVTTTMRETNAQTGTFANTTLNVMSRNAASLFGAGDMAHLAVYGSALSKAQVEAHYAARLEEASGGAALTLEFSDSAPFSESRGAGENKAQSDVVALSETLANKAGLSRADAQTFAETFLKAVAPVRAETINFSDALTRAWAGTLTQAETVALTEGLIRATTLSQADTIALSDILVYSKGFTKEDAVAFVDSLARAYMVVRGDAFALADSLSRATALARVDGVAFSDALVKATRIAPAETLAFADALFRKSGIAAADTLSFSDTRLSTWAALRSLSDSQTFADALARNSDIGRKEGVAFAEALTRAASKALADSAGFAEALAAITGLRLADALTLVDVMEKRATLSRSEALAFEDTLARTWSAKLGLADAAVVSDSKEGTLRKSIIDATNLADLAGMGVDRALADSISLADLLTPALGRVFAETLGVTDSMTRRMGLTLTDQFGLMDALLGAGGATVHFDEALLFDDALSKASNVTLSSSILLADAAANAFGLTVQESLELVDLIASSVSAARTLGLEDLLPLTDLWVKSIDTTQEEAVAFNDAFSRAWAIRQVFADAVGFSDLTEEKRTTLRLALLTLFDHALADLVLKSTSAARVDLSDRAAVTLEDSIEKPGLVLVDGERTHLVLEDE